MTAPNAALVCPFCRVTSRPADYLSGIDDTGYDDRTTWQQWRCLHCESWNDWPTGRGPDWTKVAARAAT